MQWLLQLVDKPLFLVGVGVRRNRRCRSSATTGRVPFRHGEVMNPRHVFGTVFGIESSIAAGVFILVCLTMLLALLASRRRRRRDIPPSGRSERTRLEITYGIALTAIAAFVIVLSFRTTDEERSASATPATAVRITAFQWCWRFSYPNQGVSVTGTCDGKDLPTLVVPVGQSVSVQITSSDVIHSWWVPELRYKMDAFPDHVNRFTFTVDRAGRWIGRCAEFCGNRHYTMDFYLEAVSPAKYQKWLASGGSAAALAS
jgi:cytochrome c oxidase subunit II